MIYKDWRRVIFGRQPGTDPVTADLNEEVYSLPKEQQLDYIDQCLVDLEIRKLITKEQIVIGLQAIFNNSCSDMPFSYLVAGTERRRCEAIRNFRQLYANYFEPYCVSPVCRVGCDLDDGRWVTSVTCFGTFLCSIRIMQQLPCRMPQSVS